MKHFAAYILILILLLLSCTAQAETIRQQTGAPEHTTGRWESNTGHTIITMDAAVMVPDTNCVHTYAVSGRNADYLDAMHMAQGIAADTNWERDWKCAPYPENASWDGKRESPYIVRHSDTGNIMINYLFERQPSETIGSYNWHLDTVFGEKRLTAKTSYSLKDQKFTYPLSITLSEEIGLKEYEILSGQSLTLSQARALAERWAAAFGADFCLARVGKVEANETIEIRENGRQAGNVFGPWAYWFCFTRKLEGMPVTLTNHAAFEDPDRSRDQQYESSPMTETLICVVDRDRIVHAELTNPWLVGSKRQENAALLSFDEIIRIFGSIAPLSIQASEGDVEKNKLTYANTWHITEIRLGYMPVLVKDGGGTWELRPVWDFFGIRTIAFTYDDRPCNAALTIDAINGTVIDRDYGY